jgi:hypothetical protein
MRLGGVGNMPLPLTTLALNCRIQRQRLRTLPEGSCECAFSWGIGWSVSAAVGNAQTEVIAQLRVLVSTMLRSELPFVL